MSSAQRQSHRYAAATVRGNDDLRPARRRWDRFPDRTSIIGLVGAVLAEQHNEWVDGCRCLGLKILAKSRLVLITTETTQSKEDTSPDTIGAISA